MNFTVGIDFTIIVPTRGRVPLLTNLLKSIHEKSGNLLGLEVIIVCDHDDKETIKFLKGVKWAVPQNFIYHISPVLEVGTVKLYNAAADEGMRGKYIWCLNDDVEINFKLWDIEGRRRIAEYLTDKPDRIVYIRVNDDWNDNRCCFPIVTKEFYDVVGWLLPPSIIYQPADHALGYIFGYEGWGGGKTDTPILRELDISSYVGVVHNCIHNHKRKADSTTNRAASLYPWVPVETIKPELDLAINKLHHAIFKHRDVKPVDVEPVDVEPRSTKTHFGYHPLRGNRK